MSPAHTLSIMVSAGEASGDAHAAHALQALNELDIKFRSFGMGAGLLKDQGTELLVDCRDLAVIGIVDVLINYPKFMRRLRKLRKSLIQNQPDLLLLVDYPDFNLKLAETARKNNIPVLFYVSPQVWAWRAGRVPRIGSLVSHMAVLFPFEVDIYEKAGIPVTYVGNPVVQDAKSRFSKEEACRYFGVDTKYPVITLLPGSRKGEIKRNLGIILETANLLVQQFPQLQFILPVAATLDEQFVREYLPDKHPKNLILTEKDSRDAMRAADVAMVASGTATLETALIGTPMIVMYVIHPVNYAIMKRMIRIPDVSLVNIVAQKRIVPEYIQHDAVPAVMSDNIAQLLTNHEMRDDMLRELDIVKTRMGDEGASKRVALLMRKLTAESIPVSD